MDIQHTVVGGLLRILALAGQIMHECCCGSSSSSSSIPSSSASSSGSSGDVDGWYCIRICTKPQSSSGSVPGSSGSAPSSSAGSGLSSGSGSSSSSSGFSGWTAPGYYCYSLFAYTDQYCTLGRTHLLGPTCLYCAADPAFACQPYTTYPYQSARWELTSGPFADCFEANCQ